MNSERRIQRVRAALPPVGDSLPDWKIVCRLARALGAGGMFAYSDPGDIWEEIRRVWLPGAGISYPRLDDEDGIQWPCPAEDHPGTAILHGDTFGAGARRATLRTIEFQPTPEQANDEFPFVLVTGRTLFQFNAGTMTRRSGTQHLRPSDRLEICVEDASHVGVKDGGSVRIRSRYGEATLRAELTDRVAPGTVFATFHDPSTKVNRLTGPHRDPYTHTPEYKVTAVRLTAAQ